MITVAGLKASETFTLLTSITLPSPVVFKHEDSFGLPGAEVLNGIPFVMPTVLGSYISFQKQRTSSSTYQAVKSFVALLFF